MIRNAQAVILPQGRVDRIFHECLKADVSMFPNYRARHTYPGKVGQSRLFETFQLPHPRTLRWSRVDRLKKMSKLPHEFPFVVKDDSSHEAEGVFVIAGLKSFKAAVDFLSLKKNGGKVGFVTQDFVPTGGNVLRSVIMGERVLTYWKRPSRPGQVITTISKGARVDHDWKPDLQAKGREQAKVLIARTDINLAAVDFVFPLLREDPEPLFLEINYFFGRRGLGGMEAYYRLLFEAIQDWLRGMGLNPKTVALV